MTVPVRITIPDRITTTDTSPLPSFTGSSATTTWLNLVLSRIINSTGAQAQARQLSVAGDRSVVPLVYGEDRLGALILNIVPSGANVLVQCLWSLGADSINDLRLNDAELPSGASANHYPNGGTDSGFVAAMAAAGVTYTDTLTGYAYSVVTLPQTAFTGSLSFTARIRGRKVYDPRDTNQSQGNPATWTWSNNPALCLADFLRNTSYGCGKTVDQNSVIEAANANDELVAGAEKRRLVGVSFISQSPSASIAETLRAYAGCFLAPGSSGIKLIPDKARATDATYSHDAGQIASIVKLAKKDLGNVPTVVEIIYTDTSKIPWRDASAVASAPGVDTTIPRRLSQVAMPGVHRYSQAYREAVERLNKLRTSDLELVIDVFDRGIAHEVGDVIEVTHPIGLSSKKMRVGEVTAQGEGVWRLTCVEYDPAVYSDAIAAGPSSPDTNLPNPAIIPSTPTGLSVSYTATSILLSWNKNPEQAVVEYELRVGATSWESATPLAGGSLPTIVSGTSFAWAPQPVGTYKVWIKARTAVGVESASAASVTFTLQAPTVSGLQVAVVGDQYRLTWTGNTPDLPIKSYRIKRDGNLIAEVDATYFSAKVDWTGSTARVFSVAAVSLGGSVGAESSVNLQIQPPGAVSSFSPRSIVNTVLFYWSAPTSGSLPIASYLIKKGATYGSAVVIGAKAGDQTFTLHTESEGGQFTYWIVAVDAVGNEGTPASSTINVSTPANFRLVQQFTDTAFAGTKTNAAVNAGKLYLPINTTETFSQHFTSRGWSSPQDQINAGYPVYIQPAVASGSYRQVYDAGSVVAASLVSVVLNGSWIAGSGGTITPQIEISSDNFASDVRNLGNVYEAYATSFRYVRVTITVASSGNDDVYAISSLVTKISLQNEIDSGKKLASDFTGSPPVCNVTFNKAFIDVDSIVVTPLTTARREWAVEFNDVPNPTGFTVRMWDSGGTQVATDFTWQATGVI